MKTLTAFIVLLLSTVTFAQPKPCPPTFTLYVVTPYDDYEVQFEWAGTQWFIVSDRQLGWDFWAQARPIPATQTSWWIHGFILEPATIIHFDLYVSETQFYVAQVFGNAEIMIVYP